MEERRMYKRYSVHEDVYVYRPKRVGKIHNISLGGMLCYCAYENNCSVVNFDIFCPGHTICLTGLPFSVVDVINTSALPESKRQCHIKFNKMTPEKVVELKSFIDTYAEV